MLARGLFHLNVYRYRRTHLLARYRAGPTARSSDLETRLILVARLVLDLPPTMTLFWVVSQHEFPRRGCERLLYVHMTSRVVVLA